MFDTLGYCLGLLTELSEGLLFTQHRELLSWPSASQAPPLGSLECSFICKTSYTFSSSLKVFFTLFPSCSLLLKDPACLFFLRLALFSPTLFSSLPVPKQLKVVVSLTACPSKSCFLTSRGSHPAAWKRVLLSSLCFLPFSPRWFLKYSLLSRNLDLSLSDDGSWGHSHSRFPRGSFLPSSGLCSDVTASISTAPGPDSLFLLYSPALHL